MGYLADLLEAVRLAEEDLQHEPQPTAPDSDQEAWRTFRGRIALRQAARQVLGSELSLEYQNVALPPGMYPPAHAAVILPLPELRRWMQQADALR